MQATKKRITLAQGDICYFTLGNGQPLLFFHGWGIRSRTYIDALKILATRYTVYAPDLPGLGDSYEPQRVLSFAEYAKVMEQFAVQLGLPEFHIMGHSLGGGIALSLAARSKRVQKLILADAAGVPVEYNRFTLFSVYAKQVIEEYVKPQNSRMTWITFRDYISNTRHLRYLIPLTFSITNRSIATDSSVFSRIHVPTVILWGNKDTVFTGKIAERVYHLLPRAELHYVHGTHDWLLFAPDQLRAHLKRF